MEILRDIKLPINATTKDLKEYCAKKLDLSPSTLGTFRILRRSLDARKKNDIKFVYSVEVGKEISEPKEYVIPKAQSKYPPVVVGFGPAGMIAALTLAKSGLNPIVLERGDSVYKRKEKVDSFRAGGDLDEESNAQFGAGGAGAFSDGKLNTGIGEREKQNFILNAFVKAGAPKDILIDAKPHVGTDKLLPMVENIAAEIVSLGGEIRYNTKMTGIEPQGSLSVVVTDKGNILTDSVILAIGHSARDTYKILYEKGFSMQSKPFAVGFRIEHLQKDIDFQMYGDNAGDPRLPPAEYKLVSHTPYGGVYSFCMCPGGFVTATSSEKGGIVTNGMSYSARDAVNANSALLTAINVDGGLFDGMQEQIRLERAAFALGGANYSAPCQLLKDFVGGKISQDFGKVLPTYTPTPKFQRLDSLFTTNARKAFSFAFSDFAKRIKGFDSPDALLTGVETRSSAPLRVLRGDGLNSPDYPNVYPCGEGCGYAGGIMSAAVDGLKVAEAVIAKYSGQKSGR